MGSSFLFNCAGDGSVSVKKGKAEVCRIFTESSRGGIVELPNLRLGILKEIKPEEEKLILKIGDSTVELENYGDDLIIFTDGKRQEFTNEISSLLEPLEPLLPLRDLPKDDFKKN